MLKIFDFFKFSCVFVLMFFGILWISLEFLCVFKENPKKNKKTQGNPKNSNVF